MSYSQKRMLFPLTRKDQSMNLTAALLCLLFWKCKVSVIGSVLPREVPGLKPMGTVMLRSSEFDGTV